MKNNNSELKAIESETVTHVGLQVGQRLSENDVENGVRPTALAVHICRSDCSRFISFAHQVVYILQEASFKLQKRHKTISSMLAWSSEFQFSRPSARHFHL